MLSYMSKGALQMCLRFSTLRWGDYPGLSGWSQSNQISLVLKNGKASSSGVRERDAMTQGGSERFGVADFEDGGRGPGAREGEEPLEAGKGKETDCPHGSRMDSSLADVLILAL